MMKWWFENLAGTTIWNGIDFKGPEIVFIIYGIIGIT